MSQLLIINSVNFQPTFVFPFTDKNHKGATKTLKGEFYIYSLMQGSISLEIKQYLMLSEIIIYLIAYKFGRE